MHTTGATGTIINHLDKLYYLALLKMRLFFLLFPVLLMISAKSLGQENGVRPVESSSDRVKATITKIVIEGNAVTRSKIIARETGLYQGMAVYIDTLEALSDLVRQRVYNMQLFNEVYATTSVSPDSKEVELHIKVRERWFILPTLTVQFADRNFNTWFVKENHDLRRAMIGVTLTDRNFRGNLEVLSVTAQVGYTQKLGINYMRPYANKGQTHGFGIGASMAQSRQAWYTTDSNNFRFAGIYTGPVVTRQFEGGLSYVYRPAYASRHILQLSYKDLKVSDTMLKLNKDYFDKGSTNARFIELAYRYEYNGVDNWNYSLKGFKTVANAVLRQGFEGIRFQSYANIEAGYFRPLGGTWYSSVIFRGRLMLPENQPYFFRGGLGSQTDYVRGYEYYIIDGGSYGLFRFDLKKEIFNRKWTSPIKYFTMLPVRIYPKVFFDAGYIDTPVPGNSFLSNRILYSFGAGLDIVTLYDLKIRMEFTWNHLSQNGLYLHFNSE